MKRSVCVWGVVAGGLALSASAQPAVVDFEGIPLGTQYGGVVGDVDGDLVLTDEGIDVRVRTFTEGMFSTLGFAEIGGINDDDFPTTPLSLNNIVMEFDFTNLAFAVNKVTFEYSDQGGTENLVVNGVKEELSDFIDASAVLNGVSVSVTEFPTKFGVEGVVTLEGAISTIGIGGQEVGIDNVTATPAPSSLGLLLAGGLLARRRRA